MIKDTNLIAKCRLFMRLNYGGILRLPALQGNPAYKVDQSAAQEIGKRQELPLQQSLAKVPTKSTGFDKALHTSDIETFVVGGLIPLLLVWLLGEQAAQNVGAFLVLSPLLLGLRYGFWEGTAGGFLCAAALTLMTYQYDELALDLIGIQVIALILVGMIVGEARNIWYARLNRLAREASYHKVRLDQFSVAYNLLKVSHTELEQRIAGDKSNLRLALEQLQNRQALLRSDSSQPLCGIGQELLDIVAEQGEIFTAAVYAISERSVLRESPLGIVGSPPVLSPFNPLLRETLRTGEVTTVSLRDDSDRESEQDKVLVMIPLIDSSGHMHGVISVNDMTFLRVNRETFRFLAILGNHIGNILTRFIKSIDITGIEGLLASLRRHMVDVRRHHLEVAVITCQIGDKARSQDLLSMCCGIARGLDESWIALDADEKPVVILMLPLTGEAEAMAFINRLRNATVLRAPAFNDIVMHRWSLRDYLSAEFLLDEIRLHCNILSTKPQSIASAAGKIELTQ